MDDQIGLYAFEFKPVFECSCGICGRVVASGCVGVAAMFSEEDEIFVYVVSEKVVCSGTSLPVPKFFDSLEDANQSLPTYAELIRIWGEKEGSNLETFPIPLLPGSMLSPELNNRPVFPPRQSG